MRLLFPYIVYGLLSNYFFDFVHGRHVRDTNYKLDTRVLESTLEVQAPKNLVHPGDFEKGSWGKWELDYNGYGPSGTYGVIQPGYMSKTAGYIDNTVDLFYNLTLKKGMLYHFSMDMNMTNPEECSISVSSDPVGDMLGIAGIYPRQGIVVNEWSCIEAWFVATQSVADVRLTQGCFFLSTVTHSEFDNIKLVSTGPKIYKPSSPSTAMNILKNPNFDSGTEGYLPESLHGNYSITSPGYKRAPYAIQAFLDADNEDGFASFTLYQHVNTTLGTVYRFGVAYKYDAPFAAGSCSIQGALDGSRASLLLLNVFGIALDGQKPGVWKIAEAVISPIATGSVYSVDVVCTAGNSTWELGAVELTPLN